MNNYLIAVILTFLMVFHFACSQAQSIRFSNVTKENQKIPGRPSGALTISADQTGMVYVTTEKGLFQFDGIEFRNFFSGHPELHAFEDSYFNAIYISSAGELWAGIYEEGLLRYQLTTGDYQFYRNHPGDPNSLPGNRLESIYEGVGGKIWIGTNGQGLAQYRPDENNFNCWLPDPVADENIGIVHFSNIVTGLLQNPGDSCAIWVGTLNGLFLLNTCENSFQAYHLPAIEIMDKHIRCMAFDSLNNQILVGTWGNGLWSFALSNLEFSPVHSIKNNWNKNNIRYIYNLKDHRFLIGTGTGGILLYNSLENTTEWISKTSQDLKIGLPSGFFVDQQENIWVTTLGSELFVSFFNHRLVHHVKLPANDIIKVVFHEASQRIIAVTEFSTTLFVSDTNHHLLQAIALDKIGLLKEANLRFFDVIPFGETSVLLISNRGAYQFNLKNHSLEKLNIDVSGINYPHTLFISASLDFNGHLWLGTNWEGVVFFDPVKEETKYYQHHPENPHSLVHNSWVMSIYPDHQQRVWFGTYMGFCYLDLEKDQFVNYPYRNLPPIDKGAPFKLIGAIQGMGDDRIWIGNSIRGLGVIDPLKPANLPFPTFVKSDGLGSDKIRGIYYDNSTSLTWITGEDNISVAKEHSDYRFSFFNIGSEFGVENARAIKGFLPGRVLAAKYNGYYILDFEKLQSGIKKPNLSISSMKLFEEELRASREKINDQPLKLKPTENYLSFGFKGLYYPAQERVVYQYRLAGLQNEWVDLGRRDNVSFAHLGPGKYRFEVRASIDPGEWTEPSELHFIIQPPFWKTSWFLVALGLFFAGGGRWMYKRRVKSLIRAEQKKREIDLELANVKMKALRAQMNPHFLFNCLNSIKAFIIDNESRKAASYLNKFARLIRLILQQSDDSFVKLESELEALDLYIQLESVRFEGKFDYKIEVGEEVKPELVELPPMIFQPYVENAIWHGLMQKKSKGLLLIKVNRSGKMLECIIEDNGIGRQASMAVRETRHLKRKSMGMDITKNRIELLQNIFETRITLEIEDLEDINQAASGTRVKMVFPIHEAKPTNH